MGCEWIGQSPYGETVGLSSIGNYPASDDTAEDSRFRKKKKKKREPGIPVVPGCLV